VIRMKKLEKQFENPPYILLSSCLSNVRGFSIDLLYHLKNHVMTASQLVEITGKYRQYVNQYLYRMRNYGLVEKIGIFWKITDLGISFLLHYEEVSKYRSMRKQKENKKKTKRKQSENSRVSKKPKQVSIELFLQKLSLSDAENKIIEILYRHYVETGSLFVYFPMDIYQDPYQAAEYFKIRPDKVVEAFRHLKQDRIVYKIWDWRYGACKVALYKSFVQTLNLNKQSGRAEHGEKQVLVWSMRKNEEHNNHRHDRR